MIRRYRPLTDSEIAALASRVRAAVAAWSAQWLQESVSGVTALLPLVRDDVAADEAHRWLVLRSDEAVLAAIQLSADAARRLAALIADPDRVSAAEAAHPIVSALVDRALVALVQELPDALQRVSLAPGAELPASAFVPGAGDACVTLDVGGAGVSLLLARPFIDRILGKASASSSVRSEPELEPRARAVRGGKLRLEVLLQETGLSVGDVKRLRAGDVIMFDHDISRPLRARVQSGAELGACYLGRHEGRKAIKLVKREETL